MVVTLIACLDVCLHCVTNWFQWSGVEAIVSQTGQTINIYGYQTLLSTAF